MEHRDVILCTVLTDASDPMAQVHPAISGAAVCIATRYADVPYASRGVTLPFTPALVSTPSFERTLDVVERQANIANAKVAVSGLSTLAQVLATRNTGNGITARLDLWQYGLDLADAIPLIAGRCVDVSIDRNTNTVEFVIVDGEIDESLTYPPRAITEEDFPDAPGWVIRGNRVLQTIVGPNNGRLATFPVNELLDGHSSQFFVCTPPLVVGLTVVERSDGVEPGDWQVSTLSTAAGVKYSALELELPVPSGVTVYALGGAGSTSTGPVELLCNYAGIRLSARAKSLLQTSPVRFSALLGAQGGVQEMLFERFTKQTPFAATFRLSEFDLIDCRASAGRGQEWGIGNGLHFHVPTNNQGEALARIYNEFTFHIGRTVDTQRASRPAPIAALYRSPTDGPPHIRDLLAMSQRVYGRRPMPAPYTAYDIDVDAGEDGRPTGSASGHALADSVATAYAFPRRPLTFKADRRRAMYLELGEPARLTYAPQNLDAVNCIVQAIHYPELLVTFSVPTHGEIQR